MGCTASLPKTVEGPPQIKRKRDSLAVSSSKGNIQTPANSVIKETGSANEEARASLEGRTDQIKAAGVASLAEESSRQSVDQSGPASPTQSPLSARSTDSIASTVVARSARGHESLPQSPSMFSSQDRGGLASSTDLRGLDESTGSLTVDHSSPGWPDSPVTPSKGRSTPSRSSIERGHLQAVDEEVSSETGEVAKQEPYRQPAVVALPRDIPADLPPIRAYPSPAEQNQLPQTKPVLGAPKKSFAGQWLPQSPAAQPGATLGFKGAPFGAPWGSSFLSSLGGSALNGAFSETRRASLYKQELFKKAAYLSNGSIDNRPTFQRDAVDDMPMGNPDDPTRFSWTDEALGRGNAGVGAGYGTIVMAKRGAKRQPRAPLQALPIQEPAQPTQPMSMNMDGWAAMTENLGTQNAAAVAADAAPVQNPFLTETGTQMNSIAGWQAIAADVMADEGIDPDDDGDVDNISIEDDSEDEQTSQMQTRSEAMLAKMKEISESYKERQEEIKSRAKGLFFVSYELQGKLGEGAFGEARLARRRKDGQIMVVKIMHGDNLTERAREEAKNEVRVLAALDHPNVVKYYETFVEEKTGRLQIVMEYCDEGDLDGFVRDRRGELLEEDEILLKFVQICLGLQHVHSKGIIHRDLKGNNIFCCKGGILKLGDFGISKMLTPQARAARTMIGTPYYMSPEILKGRAYDGKTDIWAIGCILYELCSLKKAFDAGNVGAITVKVMSGKYPPIPAKYGNSMKALVDTLIRKEPNDRPDLEAVLQLEIVKRGLTLYQEHLHQNKLKRQQSFERSLQELGSMSATLSMSSTRERKFSIFAGVAPEDPQSPEALKAAEEAARAAEAEAERKRVEDSRLAEAQMRQIRALEEQSAFDNIDRYFNGQDLKPFDMTQLDFVSITTEQDLPRWATASSQGRRGLRQSEARGNAIPSGSTRPSHGPATTEPGPKGVAPQGPQPYVDTAGHLPALGEYGIQGIVATFSPDHEEADDANVLRPMEAATPPKQGPQEVLSQIDNFLQLPTIDKIETPPPTPEQLKAARRQQISISAS